MTAVRLTIEALKTVAPLAPLTPCAELEQAALDHANDTELKGLIGHVGSDGSFTPDRIKRYGNWAVQVGENLRYGNDNPRDAVVAWLIDDGRVARGHRKNLLNPGNRNNCYYYYNILDITLFASYTIFFFSFLFALLCFAMLCIYVTDFTYLGAAIGGHEKYGTCVVASFAHSFSA